MSIEALKRIRALRLAPGDKLTLMIMATYASRDGSNVFPSVKLVAEQSGCTDRALQQRLVRLRAAGYLEVQAPARQHRPTTYRVVVPKEIRDESGCTSEAQSEVNRASPLGAVRGESRVASGEPTFATGVNGISPDQNRDQSDQKDKAAAPPRFSMEAREPNANGNYRVIHRLAMDLLHRRQFDSESDLVDAVKWACGERSIDYGAHPEVATHVVHRACASAWWKTHQPINRQSGERPKPSGRTGPPPPGKYAGVGISDDD